MKIFILSFIGSFLFFGCFMQTKKPAPVSDSAIVISGLDSTGRYRIQVIMSRNIATSQVYVHGSTAIDAAKK